jgi:hypothetical protein
VKEYSSAWEGVLHPKPRISVVREISSWSPLIIGDEGLDIFRRQAKPVPASDKEALSWEVIEDSPSIGKDGFV